MPFLLLICVLCDNIQLHKNEFESLKIGEIEYLSRNMPDNSRLRISYPGYLVYKLEQVGPRNFIIADKTVYIPFNNTSIKERNFLFILEVVENLYYTAKKNIKISILLINVALLGLTLFKHIIPIWIN